MNRSFSVNAVRISYLSLLVITACFHTTFAFAQQVFGGPPTASDIKFYCNVATAPQGTASAALDQPSCTSYTWTIIDGQKICTLLDNSGKPITTWSGAGTPFATCQYQGIGGGGSVTIQLTYEAPVEGGPDATDVETVTFFIHHPVTPVLAKDPDDFINGGLGADGGPASYGPVDVFYDVKYSGNAGGYIPDDSRYGFTSQVVWWVLHDTEGNGMPGETVTEHWMLPPTIPANNPNFISSPNSSWTTNDSSGIFDSKDLYTSTNNFRNKDVSGRYNTGSDIITIKAYTTGILMATQYHDFLIADNTGTACDIFGYETTWNNDGAKTGVSSPKHPAH